jgi:DNA segregation ATPase FtsK/SpoIIIE-like protein
MTHTKDEVLNIAGQCRATASSPLAKTIAVDGGGGLLCELLLDAAKAIEALAAQPAPVQEPVAQEPLTDGYVQLVPDKCDRIVWRTRYFHLPIANTPPAAQPAPVPLTDDPLQGAVDWLLQADGEYFCTATVQRTLRIGYNRAKRLCDTAKERAAHGITAAAEKGN